MPNSDLISRAAAITQIKENYCDWCDHADLCQSCETRDCIATIEQQVPAVDAVPVVRCKDCRYYNTSYCGDGCGWCERKGIGHGTSDDWFCADGERADAPTCGPDYCEIGGDGHADG